MPQKSRKDLMASKYVAKHIGRLIRQVAQDWKKLMSTINLGSCIHCDAS